MANIGVDSRGTMIQLGDVWRINNALVEETFISDGRPGYLLVSYAVKDFTNTTYIEQLRLNVGHRTIITDQFGNRVAFSQIMPGMWVDVEFSPNMTRSMPPQTTAYHIVVQRNGYQAVTPSPMMTDRIVGVDLHNNILLTGNIDNVNRQTRFVVTDETVILNKNGQRIPLGALQTSQWVRITHADFMTMSIPPQTTALRIQVL